MADFKQMFDILDSWDGIEFPDREGLSDLLDEAESDYANLVDKVAELTDTCNDLEAELDEAKRELARQQLGPLA